MIYYLPVKELIVLSAPAIELVGEAVDVLKIMHSEGIHSAKIFHVRNSVIQNENNKLLGDLNLICNSFLSVFIGNVNKPKRVFSLIARKLHFPNMLSMSYGK